MFGNLFRQSFLSFSTTEFLMFSESAERDYGLQLVRNITKSETSRSMFEKELLKHFLKNRKGQCSYFLTVLVFSFHVSYCFLLFLLQFVIMFLKFYLEIILRSLFETSATKNQFFSKEMFYTSTPEMV